MSYVFLLMWMTLAAIALTLFLSARWIRREDKARLESAETAAMFTQIEAQELISELSQELLARDNETALDPEVREVIDNTLERYTSFRYPEHVRKADVYHRARDFYEGVSHDLRKALAILQSTRPEPVAAVTDAETALPLQERYLTAGSRFPWDEYEEPNTTESDDSDDDEED